MFKFNKFSPTSGGWKRSCKLHKTCVSVSSLTWQDREPVMLLLVLLVLLLLLVLLVLMFTEN